MSRQFFVLFALSAAWLVSVDLIYAGSFTLAAAFNAVGVGLGVLVALSRKVGVHVGGTAFAWALTIGDLILSNANYLA